MINNEIQKCYSIFGNLKKKGVLDSIRVYDTERPAIASYNYKLKQIIFKKSIVGISNSKEYMTAISEKNYKKGFWSTNAPEHQIRHELGHAVEMSLSQEKIKEIENIRLNIIDQCGITQWSRNDFSHFEVAGKYLSYYALETNGEFIAESIAEYLNKKPRKTALKVIEIILKG